MSITAETAKAHAKASGSIMLQSRSGITIEPANLGGSGYF